MRPRALVGATALAVLVAVGGCGGSSATPHAVLPPLSPLHATRGPGAALLDAHGRTVVLRAISVNQLGDYYADNPTLPTVAPLEESDFAQIAALGFDAVRLTISWSSLEPHRGTIDAAYVARIHQAVRRAAGRRLYVIIDMHQDAWGKFIATPAGTVCPAGSQAAIGWDGAPEWATVLDGQTTCRGPAREISRAVETAWANFYADTQGVQTELVTAWGALARSFAADPAVAGFDLVNEPHPGPTFGTAELAPLSQYYGRALGAIRAGERGVAGGFAHLVFFEPMVTWFLVGASAVPPSFSPDPDVVYAPHLYGGSLSDNTGTVIADGFAEAAAEAARFGTPWWSGEWGWFGTPAEDAPLVAQYARQEDAELVGGAWWDWKQTCGDPHQIGSPGAAPRPVSDGLVRFSCPSGANLGSPPEFTGILSRAYPRAAPGRMATLTSDPVSGAAEVGGTASAPGTAELWVPGAGRPVVTGAAAVSLHQVPGGWILEAAVKAGPYDLHLHR